MRIAVTGAAGQIGYALVPLIANGDMLGKDTPVILQMLDIAPAMDALNGVVMELHDGAFPCLAGARRRRARQCTRRCALTRARHCGAGVVATDDPAVAFRDADICVLVGAFPRKQGMERKDLLEKNSSIFKAQGQAINDHARPNVKVRPRARRCQRPFPRFSVPRPPRPPQSGRIRPHAPVACPDAAYRSLWSATRPTRTRC